MLFSARKEKNRTELKGPKGSKVPRVSWSYPETGRTGRIENSLGCLYAIRPYSIAKGAEICALALVWPVHRARHVAALCSRVCERRPRIYELSLRRLTLN